MFFFRDYKGVAYKDGPETIFFKVDGPEILAQNRTGDTFLVFFRTGQNFVFRFLFIFKSIL